MAPGPQLSHRPIVLLLGDDRAEVGWIQPLAGGELWTERPLAAGARPATRPAAASEALSASAVAAAAAADVWSVTYDGPGLVDGGLHSIRSALSARGLRRVDFEDGESFLVEARGDIIVRQGSGAAGALALERALGAPLALALALRDIHLLHASALLRRNATGTSGGAVAFTANSGAGKSTLAAAAASWMRIADDQLAVRLDPPVCALAHFPQLKLPETAGYPEGAAPVLPLERLVEIEHSPDFRTVEIARLSPSAACLALARATVAAKLFDPILLQRHFELCAAAGRELPVHRLRFPTGLEHLPEVLAAIAELQE